MTDVNSSLITVKSEHSMLVHKFSAQLSLTDQVYITQNITLKLVIMFTDLPPKLPLEQIMLKDSEQKTIPDQVYQQQKKIGISNQIPKQTMMVIYITQFLFHTNVLQTTVNVKMVDSPIKVTPTVAKSIQAELMEKAS